MMILYVMLLARDPFNSGLINAYDAFVIELVTEKAQNLIKG
jgi:hypothetical protein